MQVRGLCKKNSPAPKKHIAAMRSWCGIQFPTNSLNFAADGLMIEMQMTDDRGQMADDREVK
jgi:hypothetical protein